MAQGLVTHEYLEDIADAIREKLGTQDTYTPSQMANAVMQIPTGGVEIVPWATGTDEQISAMIQAAHNGDIDLQTDGGWAIGDVRTIAIASFTDSTGISHSQQDIDIAISSFADYNSCGCVMQFDFKDCLAEAAKINTYGNSGGWSSCSMKETMASLVNALPSWLKSGLIEFSVLTSAGGQSSSIVTDTGNKLALRSEVEVFGTATNSFTGEGSQIPYYTTEANRTKKKGHTGSNFSWWERSPHKVSSAWCIVTSSASTDTSSASYTSGVAPFGCL